MLLLPLLKGEGGWEGEVCRTHLQLDKIKQTKVTSQTGTIMNQAIEGVRWTVHDLEVIPENEWTRYEIINGELFVTRTPHRRHQQVCGKIFGQLDTWSEWSGLGETIVTPGVLFSEADNVIPDVVWVSRERCMRIFVKQQNIS